MSTSILHRARRVALLALMCGVPALSLPAKAADPRVDRLTDLMVEAIPMGRVFEVLADDDPTWPVGERADRVTGAQLACLRGQLSVAGHRAMKRDEVAAYVERRGAEVDGDIRVLADGAAMLMGRLMLGGAEAERAGRQVSEQELMAGATNDQLAAFMAFMTAPEQGELRALAGIGNAFSAERSAEENKAAGEGVGGDLATRAMLAAMKRCDVPATLFAN